MVVIIIIIIKGCISAIVSLDYRYLSTVIMSTIALKNSFNAKVDQFNEQEKECFNAINDFFDSIDVIITKSEMKLYYYLDQTRKEFSRPIWYLL